jgi:hypothetical protein
MPGRPRPLHTRPTEALEAELRRLTPSRRRTAIERELSDRAALRVLSEPVPAALLAAVFCRTCDEELSRRLNAHSRPYFVSQGAVVSECPCCSASLSDAGVRRSSCPGARVRWRGGLG